MLFVVVGFVFFAFFVRFVFFFRVCVCVCVFSRVLLMLFFPSHYPYDIILFSPGFSILAGRQAGSQAGRLALFLVFFFFCFLLLSSVFFLANSIPRQFYVVTVLYWYIGGRERHGK